MASKASRGDWRGLCGNDYVDLLQPIYLHALERLFEADKTTLVANASSDVIRGQTREVSDPEECKSEESAMHESKEITWHISNVSVKERAVLQRQNAATIWLTGLSASGKSTLAYELERRLHDLGHANYVLDGDNIRHGLSSDLGFSPENRKENIRRVAKWPNSSMTQDW